ncbi:hypothetical protein EV421DRAFT_1739792 [Armillaria borealis]|uniref:Uncharacterized protein n=1 Tax=Armillaria borealis TaxID=47425 RepID=A0AA39J8E5_9AGAR|nr:hypothetical protein EV421DRAFT_1739792 [Armillaria borealis]
MGASGYPFVYREFSGYIKSCKADQGAVNVWNSMHQSIHEAQISWFLTGDSDLLMECTTGITGLYQATPGFGTKGLLKGAMRTVSLNGPGGTIVCLPRPCVNDGYLVRRKTSTSNHRVESVLRQCTAFWRARCRGRQRIWEEEDDCPYSDVSCVTLTDFHLDPPASRVFFLIPSTSLSPVLVSTLLCGTRVAPSQRTYHAPVNEMRRLRLASKDGLLYAGRTVTVILSDPGSGFQSEPQNPLSSSLWRLCLPQGDVERTRCSVTSSPMQAHYDSGLDIALPSSAVLVTSISMLWALDHLLETSCKTLIGFEDEAEVEDVEFLPSTSSLPNDAYSVSLNMLDQGYRVSCSCARYVGDGQRRQQVGLVD